MELIIEWDVRILYWIHQGWSSSVLDVMAPLIRNKFIWLPLYISIVTYILSRNSLYRSSYILLLIIGSVILTDMTSGQFLKKYVERLRPCREPIHTYHIQPKVRCSYSYSFPSAHATNHFGLATILTFALGWRGKQKRWLLFGWALAISVAQVYVGIHYPLDVLAGGLLGVVLARFYLRLARFWVPDSILASL
ncbi:MAG: phosphatase PAP2 family protein [Bacteroidota bacterium]